MSTKRLLRISSKLSLPIEAALWTFAVLAIKGAGKTYTASVLAEEMIKNGIPIIAIDPIGVWWGLQSGAKKGTPGLPVVIFGGEHKNIDLPTKLNPKTHTIQVDEEKLKEMALSILKSGINAVIDTSDLSKSMQRRMAAIFIDEVYHKNKKFGVRHVFLEEADTLAPQKISGDLAFTEGAVDNLVRRGGNFNLGATIISQRSAVVNKDVLTQCNCLVAMRILAKRDKKAVAEWVEDMAEEDPKKFDKWYKSLKSLKNGEAWLWNPIADIFEKVTIRKRETLHATREYFDQADWAQKDIGLADVDSSIEKFKLAFASASKAKSSEAKTSEAPPSQKQAPEAQVSGMRVGDPTPSPSKSSIAPEPASGAEEPQSESSDEPEVINIEERRYIYNLSKTDKPISITTDDTKGQILFVLYLKRMNGGGLMTEQEIEQEAAENGWTLTRFEPHMRDLVRSSKVRMEGTGYRLPKHVTFNLVKPS